MATKRKQDNETDEQRNERLLKEAVSNYATRSEKTSWNRKRTNLERVVDAKIRPIEERILDLQLELRPLYDEMKLLREDMVESCVHPYDLLVVTDNSVYCKFCGKKMARPSTESIRDQVESGEE